MKDEFAFEQLVFLFFCNELNFVLSVLCSNLNVLVFFLRYPEIYVFKMESYISSICYNILPFPMTKEKKRIHFQIKPGQLGWNK